MNISSATSLAGVLLPLSKGASRRGVLVITAIVLILILLIVFIRVVLAFRFFPNVMVDLSLWLGHGVHDVHEFRQVRVKLGLRLKGTVALVWPPPTSGHYCTRIRSKSMIPHVLEDKSLLLRSEVVQLYRTCRGDCPQGYSYS